MVVYKNSYTFDSDLKSISLAYFNKYPNRLSTHIINVDTYSRELQDNKLIISRIIDFDVKLPWFFERLRSKFLDKDYYKFLKEKITIDRDNNSMNIEVKNLIQNNYLNIIERSEYKCYNKKCIYNQSIVIDTPFSIVEKFVYNLLQGKSNSSIMIMEEKIKNVNII
jgi:4-amino-4-deoxychorismate lyase